MNILTITDEVNAINIELVDVEGLQDLKEEISLSDDNTITFSVTGELSVTGNEGFVFIRDYFFGCGDLCANSNLKASVYIECCDTTQEFIIERNNVKYDLSSCRIEFEMLTSSTVEQGKDLLSNRYWWFEYLDDREFTDFIHYRATSEALAFTKYKSYLFLDILNYQLEKAGFILQSNLLNSDPYNNICFTFNNAEFVGIVDNRDARTNTRTVEDLIKDVATLLNAEFIYTKNADGQNVLIFEHKSYFLDINNYSLLSLDNFNVNNNLLIQYKEIEKNNCKSIYYAYEYSGITEYVVETAEFYNDIVDFPNNLDIRAEACTKLMPFHAPRIESSGITAGYFEQLIPGEFKSDRDIIITIWDGNGNKGEESETHLPIWSAAADIWNYPLFFNKDSLTGLYQKFHYLDDPSVSSCQFEVANNSIDLVPNGITFCEVKGLIDKNGLFILFTVTDSEGCVFYLKPNNIVLDYENNTVTLENLSFV